MELALYKIDGSESSKTVTLDDSVFGIKPNEHVMYLDVKQYLANRRQGTHKAKQRAEVAYSTKKMGRQKGGGGARHGSIKSPIYVGGGRVFGPVPRDYRFKLNKKVKSLARRSALSDKAKGNAVIVVEDFTFEAPKTKKFLEISNNLKISDKKFLVVLAESNNNVYLSSRNLPKAKVVTASDLTTYDILNASKLVLFEGAVDKIHSLFGVSKQENTV
ncbi:MAG: 50S ribosomal protein L4 [Prevotellaceae bacterium]|jgi:large subunit ribosomal protein L4|nr:50S ribosomal protein L4 [Prevotellaceae bacterium]